MKTSWSKSLPIFLVIFFVGVMANAQVAKMQALYLFQFAKNVGWPEADANKDFVVAVVGDSEVASELRSIASNKRVGSRAIEIREVNSAKDLDGVSIVYVSSNKASQLGSYYSSLYNKPTLLVSGEKGQCSNGASISFCKIAGNKLGFEVSERNIKKSGLSITPKLLNLGKSVG